MEPHIIKLLRALLRSLSSVQLLSLPSGHLLIFAAFVCLQLQPPLRSCAAWLAPIHLAPPHWHESVSSHRQRILMADSRILRLSSFFGLLAFTRLLLLHRLGAEDDVNTFSASLFSRPSPETWYSGLLNARTAHLEHVFFWELHKDSPVLCMIAMLRCAWRL